MYNVNLTTEDKDFAKMIMDCITDSLDEFEPEGYTSYSMSNVKEEEKCECEECKCCEEDGWCGTKDLGFGEAFEIIKNNPELGMRLPYWDEDEVVRVQNPDTHSKMSYPYLYMAISCENFPYIPCYEDIFSDDWEIVEMED